MILVSYVNQVGSIFLFFYVQVQGVSGGTTASPPAHAPETDIDKAVRSAKDLNKLLYVHYGRPGCGNCLAMKRYYPQLDFSNFIMVDANCDSPSFNFCRRYNVFGRLSLPVIIIAKPDDSVVEKLMGYVGKDDMATHLKAAWGKCKGNPAKPHNGGADYDLKSYDEKRV